MTRITAQRSGERKMQQPSWWKYSEQHWTQLREAFLGLQNNTFEVDELANKGNWQLVSGGVSNFNYRLSLGGSDYFVQLVDSEKQIRLPARGFGSVYNKIGSVTGLSSRVPACLAELESLRVSQWVEAKPTLTENFNNPQLLGELCDFLSCLHRSNLALPELDIHRHLHSYYQSAVAKTPQKNAELKEAYQRALVCAKDFVASNSCHNDLSSGNILLSSRAAGKLYIVDWEYASIGDPLFDLAGFCSNFCLDAVQQERLLRVYLNKVKSTFDRKKFNRMKELYQLVSLLWSYQ